MIGQSVIDPNDRKAFGDLLVRAGLNAEGIAAVRDARRNADKMVGVLDFSEAPALRRARTTIIDLDAAPYCPGGWSVKSHHKGGQLLFDPADIEIFRTVIQECGVEPIDRDVFRSLDRVQLLNANMLDWYLNNSEYIPEPWKENNVFFWGTRYINLAGSEVVCCLCWFEHQWSWGFRWVGDGFDRYNPAAVRRRRSGVMKVKETDAL